jgi:hypothetical protein
MTASHAGRLQGRTPIEAVLGKTPDTSEHLNLGFYDWVWFKRDAGTGEIEIGKWLGVSKSAGSLMSCCVLPITGMPVSRTMVQRVTELEKQTEANQQRSAACDTAVAGRFKEGRLVTAGGKPDLAAWSEPLETDPDFAEEFAQTFDNPSVPEADDEFDPDSCDSCLNMELALERDDTTPEFAKVTKRMKDAAGNPIGAAHDNPVLDARLHEVECLDGHKAVMSANIVAENMLAQVGQMLFEAIIDHRNDVTALQGEKTSIKNSSGGSRNVETTKGWECLIQWHDGSAAWNKIKDVKDSYPVQLAEHAVENALEREPAFRCWTMSPEKHVKAAIENVEKKLGGELPFSKGQCPTPMRTDCHPAEDTSAELDAEGLGDCQELIGVSRWAVEIGRLDISLEMSLLSSHLALPRKGHLEQVCHIFASLKHRSRRRIHLDPSPPLISESRFQAYKHAEEPIPSNMPTARGRIMSTHCFVDSDHAGDKVSRRSQTGMLSSYHGVHQASKLGSRMDMRE